jgi:RNA polymerase sigma factor (sigma-70 family)
LASLEEEWNEDHRAAGERERRISALALRYRSGELGMLGEIFAEFASLVSRTIQSYLIGGGVLPAGIDPEDLYQQAYVELAEAIRDWDPGLRDNFVPYVLRSLPWRIDHYLRSQSPNRRTSILWIHSTPHDRLMERLAGNPGLDGRDWDDDLAWAEMLRKLPARYQEVVRLHLFYGLSFSEAGKMMGIGRSSAHEAFRRAIEYLRSMLE